MKHRVDHTLVNPPPACEESQMTRTPAEEVVLADFMKAFMHASGLPLELRGKNCADEACCCGMKIPGFCQLIHDSNSPILREICGLFNRQLEGMAADHPHNARCFAGIQLSAVPIHEGSGKVEYFKTGHVMLERPVARDFPKVMLQLSRAGLEALTKKAKDAWLAIPMMEQERYQAFVDLLDAFARKLSGYATEQEEYPESADSLLMREAQLYIEKNSAKQLKLSEVANVVSLSPNYFCSKFHDFTGLSFTDYLAGIRVANAARLLSQPSKRIKEIAYGVGFNSISQFNRVFRATMGMSASAFRQRGKTSS